MNEKLLILLVFISGFFIVSCGGMMEANTANTSSSQQTNGNKAKEIEEKVTFLVPKSSAFFPVGKDKFLTAEESTDLRTAGENLKSKLNKAGYGKTRFHKINNGFAVVSGVQRFNGENWESLGEAAEKISARSFEEYKKYLVSGKKTFYRFVVFTVTTDENPEDIEKIPTFEEALTWAVKKTATSSTKTTSPNMKDVFDQPLTNDYECLAHFYVFEKNYTIDAEQFIPADSTRAQNYLDELMK